MTATAVPTRTPFDLPQYDDRSCFQRVTAQIRWLLHASNLEGEDAVAYVRSWTGVGSDDDTNTAPEIGLLLADGLTVRRISNDAGNPDLLRTGRIERLRATNAKHWSKRAERYWTDERIDEEVAWLDAWRRDDDLLASRYGNYAREDRTPTVGDILDLLADGWMVPLFFHVGDPGASHAVLAYGLTGDGRIRLYDSLAWEKSSKTLVVASVELVERRWLGDDLLAVGP